MDDNKIRNILSGKGWTEQQIDEGFKKAKKWLQHRKIYKAFLKSYIYAPVVQWIECRPSKFFGNSEKR